MYKIIKRKAKLFFKRLKSQNGSVVLTTLAILGIAALGASLFSFGEKAMEYKKDRVDMTEYGEAQASGDPGKDQEKNSAGLVEMAVEGGKVGVGVYDDTGLLTILEKSGALNVEKKEDKKDEEKNKEIEKKLKENNLPSDPLMVGIAEVTENKVKRNSDSDIEQEDIDEVVIDTLEELKVLDEPLDSDSGDEDKIKEPKFNIISHINNILDASGKLADQKVIEKRKELDKTNSEKKYIEMEMKAYKDYEDKGYIVTDTSDWANFEDRLDELNNKISELTTEIQKNEDKSQEVADEEDTEDQETEDVLTDEETQDTSTDEEEPEEIIEDTKEAPTIILKIVAGPTYSEEDKVCFYRVKAEVTGDPDPEITFSKDDSGGAWGSDTVQINLKEGGSCTLKATATNSEGQATDSINLPWGCTEVPMGSVTLKGTGKLTGCIDRDYYSITMTINLDTGNITGNISFSCTQPKTVIEIDPDTGEEMRRYSINCSFKYSSSLHGKMNLETRNINASSSGKLAGTSGGDCSQIQDRYETFTLCGTLNESNTFASGTDWGGDYWSVSR